MITKKKKKKKWKKQKIRYIVESYALNLCSQSFQTSFIHVWLLYIFLYENNLYETYIPQKKKKEEERKYLALLHVRVYNFVGQKYKRTKWKKRNILLVRCF